MPTAIFTIARSGLGASRANLELTAQNVANATNPNFARRTLGQSELVMSGTIGPNSSDSLGGVRVGGVERAESTLSQRQVRDSAAALASAAAQGRALGQAESGLETSGLFTSLADFEAALTRLQGGPTDPGLRVAALESARQLAARFADAANAITNARRLAQDEASANTLEVNELAGELARINRDLAGARPGTAGRASLFDARDSAIRGLAEQFALEIAFAPDGTATVALAGTPPATLVSGAATATLTTTLAPDGTLEFAVGGSPLVPAGGAMAGRAAALADMATLTTQLDALAAATISIGNTRQAAGAALDGTPGQPLFAGSGAGNITMVLAAAAGLATAPAGSAPGSREAGNLAHLLADLGAETGPASGLDTLLLGLSSRVAALETRRDGLSVVAASAEAELLRETGVDLDTEAANLVRLQQAFEANSRVVQVAADLFDTVLALR